MTADCHDLFDAADLRSLFHYDVCNICGPLVDMTADLDPREPGWDRCGHRDFSSVVREIGADILAVPFLEESFCRRFVRFLDLLDAFTIGTHKDAFAAPELKIRDLSPLAERMIIRSITLHLAPIMYAHWRILPSLVHPPFAIRYTLETQVGMDSHHDRHADVSISVNLNDGFAGGGLAFPRQNCTTKGLTIGTAVMFPGRVTHLHQGVPITEGQRYVLTVWTEHRE